MRTRQDLAAGRPRIPTVVTVPEVVNLAIAPFRARLGRWGFRRFPQFDGVAGCVYVCTAMHTHTHPD